MKTTPCPLCRGSGRVNGFYAGRFARHICPKCDGTGTLTLDAQGRKTGPQHPATPAPATSRRPYGLSAHTPPQSRSSWLLELGTWLIGAGALGIIVWLSFASRG